MKKCHFKIHFECVCGNEIPYGACLKPCSKCGKIAQYKTIVDEQGTDECPPNCGVKDICKAKNK